MSLKLKESVVPITDLKSRSREIVKKAQRSGKPILITQRGRAAAVLVSIESYEKKEEYYEEIEGILAALKEAEQGKLHPHKEALKILESF